MIMLTKLDKSRVLVSLANIKYVESTPDTLVRFTNGDMLIVCESLEEISRLVMNFKARCLAGSQEVREISMAQNSQTKVGGITSWT